MVSLWPWRVDDVSAASFEKTLSSISLKIHKSNAQLDRLRQISRRIRALWTLYTSFAYMLYSIILALAVGWHNWGRVEYSAIISGPVIIYVVRLLFTAYYNYRISSITAKVESLQKEKDSTIEKLKAATKYNTTQELLEKYGAAPPSVQSTPQPAKGRKGKSLIETPNSGTPIANKEVPRRTGMTPPPTANLVRRSPAAVEPATSPLMSLPPSHMGQSYTLSPLGNSQGSLINEEIKSAKNTYNNSLAPAQYSAASQPQWYDRVFDLLMGEDETLPRNRIALICSHCRLVNGQAPPGTQSLEEIGKWRCSGCGGWNGVEAEAKKLVAEMQEQVKTDDEASPEPVITSDRESHESSDEHILTPAEADHTGDISSNTDLLDEGHSSEKEIPKVKKGRPKRNRKGES